MDEPTTAPEGEPTTVGVELTAVGPMVSPTARPADDVPHGEAPGRRFGDHELLEVLGHGGMGVVYRARQSDLGRVVALKMLRSGLFADDAELRRFRNEVEAVALLDHPNLVPIYEVGRHEGRPFYTMKLIEGGGLDARLAEFANPAAAARLVAEAAGAVHHAHLRGILHRDLKPANILLDREGRPHVTDFGLAKQLGDQAELTQSGAILGTPAYMAPEQASGRRGAVTTASDVHGLGATLYALLTGRAPFQGDSMADTLERVRDRPPDPPSRLRKGIPSDLERICLTCLAKDPSRRYPSAEAVADDLVRWLEGRPISARPVGATARLGMWCRRRPLPAALAVTLLAAVIAGGVGVGVQWRRAEANLVIARRERSLAMDTLRRERAALALSRERLALAGEAIESFYTGASEDVLLRRPELADLRDRLLRTSLDFYERLQASLESEPDPDDRTRADLAQAYAQVGAITNRIGSKAEALQAHERALALREALAASRPDDAEAARQLGISLNQTGTVLRQLRRLPESLALGRRSEAVFARLHAERPGDPGAVRDLAYSLGNLGVILQQTGEDDEALRVHRRALGLLRSAPGFDPADPATAGNLAFHETRIGYIYQVQGRWAEAIGPERRAIAAYEASRAPRDADLKASLAMTVHDLGLSYRSTRRPAEALVQFARAAELRDQVVAEQSTDLRQRGLLGETEAEAAAILLRLGRPDEADRWARRAIDRLETIFADGLAWPEHATFLRKALDVSAAIHEQAGRDTEALARLRRLLDPDGGLYLHPTNDNARHRQAGRLVLLARLERTLGDSSASLDSGRRAAALLEAIRDPDAVDLYNLACARALSDEADRALQALRAAIVAGWTDALHTRTDPDLASLRPRRDFQDLVADLAFPTEPFAP